MIDNMFVNKNESFMGVLKILDKNAKGTAFVIDDKRRFVGVMTDGDVRRALMSGASLDESIDSYVNRNSIYIMQGTPTEDILNKFDSHIKILPVLNRDMEVIDYHEYKAEFKVPVASPFLRENELKYATEAILSTWISSKGKYITEFENKFSNYCGCKYGVATSNGTTALHLALVALGIKAGDEVLVPNLTFAASLNVVIQAGATPVLVDVEKDSWCIDPRKIEEAITEKTKAIIPVHLYGQPCDMEKIMKLAHDYDLYVIEDCAEAHGAEFNGKKVGSFGDIGCFSFFGNKVITTGEGGMCITNNHELDTRLRMYRDHGMSRTRRYWHDVVGYNYRMTNIQAAIGVAQVERIDYLLEERNKVEQLYTRHLSKIPEVIIQKNDFEGRKKIAWLMSILIPADKRDNVLEYMQNHGVEVRPFFYPLSDMEVYKPYISKKMRVSEEISKCGMNLPTVVNLTEEEIINIVNILRDALAK